VSPAGVEARELGKRFGPVEALGGLDISLEPGRCLALLGPNGAGKSTLLRLVAGLARPTIGSLTLDGVDAHQREARRRVGYIGHSSLLYPELSARENLVFAARLHHVGDPEARADALLREEALTDVAARPVSGFSRGMAQRVAIARGLVHDPDVVLLDEPFTGLDRRAARRLEERLDALRASGHTLVLVTHDLAAASRLAQHVVVLSDGRIAHESREAVAHDALERFYVEALEARSS
jgi:heme exporter protein A